MLLVRRAEAAFELAEARVFAERVEHRLDVEVCEEACALVEGAREVFERACVVAESEMHERRVVCGDESLTRALFQLREKHARLPAVSGLAADVAEVRLEREAAARMFDRAFERRAGFRARAFLRERESHVPVREHEGRVERERALVLLYRLVEAAREVEGPGQTDDGEERERVNL